MLSSSRLIVRLILGVAIGFLLTAAITVTCALRRGGSFQNGAFSARPDVPHCRWRPVTVGWGYRRLEIDGSWVGDSSRSPHPLRIEKLPWWSSMRNNGEMPSFPSNASFELRGYRAVYCFEDGVGFPLACVRCTWMYADG